MSSCFACVDINCLEILANVVPQHEQHTKPRPDYYYHALAGTPNLQR